MDSGQWKCQPGACLMIPSGPAGEHLFTVVSGPMIVDGHGSAPQALMVSFTSIKPGVPHDAACEISAGEHPFITRASSIYYREPRLEKVSKIEHMVRTGAWRVAAPCAPALTKKILAGFAMSKRLPRHFRLLLEEIAAES